MNIGQKIKEKRKLLSLTQDELASRCEFSKAFISQLENDKVSPSVENLEVILEVLGTNISDFFKDDSEPKIIFKESEQNVKDYDTYKTTWLVPTSQELEMEPIIVEIKPGGEVLLDYPHQGEEFGYVLSGSVIVAYGDNEFECNEGESFYYECKKNHYLKNKTHKTCKILWISSPPNF